MKTRATSRNLFCPQASLFMRLWLACLPAISVPASLAVRVLSRSLALLLVFSAPPCLRGDSSGGAPIELGPRKQLFLDDYLIASKTNVTLRIHPAEKSRDNPVIRQTEPWEDPFNIVYGSVIRDGDK